MSMVAVVGPGFQKNVGVLINSDTGPGD